MKAKIVAAVICVAAFLAASAFLQHLERESLAQELEQWQQQEWIDNLLEMRRQELTNQIKHKPA